MQSMNNEHTSGNHTTNKLNDLLEGEMSAVETYNTALKTVENWSCKTELETAMQCHEERARAITSKVLELGAQPSQSSGAWGAFANTMESGAALFGEKAAVSMLEEGEDHGIKQYKELLDDSDLAVQQVAQNFYSRQEGTHKMIKDLKTRLA